MNKQSGSTRRDSSRARLVAGAVARFVFSPALLMDVVAPAIAYQLLVRHGIASTSALIGVAVFPLLGIAVAAARRRRLDPIGLLAFIAITVGLVAGLVLHDARLLLVKDSVVTGVLGVVFLLSLPARRPMIFVLQRRLLTRAGTTESFEQTWADPRVRVRSRRMTALWGVTLIVEAAARVALYFVVSPGNLLIISPLLATVMFGPLALWTVLRRPKPRHTDQNATTPVPSNGATATRA